MLTFHFSIAAQIFSVSQSKQAKILINVCLLSWLCMNANFAQLINDNQTLFSFIFMGHPVNTQDFQTLNRKLEKRAWTHHDMILNSQVDCFLKYDGYFDYFWKLDNEQRHNDHKVIWTLLIKIKGIILLMAIKAIIILMMIEVIILFMMIKVLMIFRW